ncbi:MAG: DUF551 domain-containing protein [Pseudomonadota bacterium]
MTDWIKVGDKLPEIGKKVLVRVVVDGGPKYFEDRLVKFVRTSQSNWSQSTWSQAIDSGVTHWIELPQGCPTCGCLE